MSAPVTIGLFVGGAGTRMGGVAKGTLRAPGSAETLLERLVRVCAQVAPHAVPYLVGRATAYAGLGLPTLTDDPCDVGPIGGMRSLLKQAREAQSPLVLALACDLPFIDEAVIARLIEPLGAAAARVPLAEQRLQPLAAAYAPRRALEAVDRSLAVGRHALMQVLGLLGSEVETLNFDDARALVLRDWDTPEDMQDH